MKKLGLILVSFGFAILLAGNAQAVPYAVNFDADAAGTTYGVQTIFGWDLEAFATETIPVADNVTIFGNGTGQLVDIVTHQQLDGPNAGNVSGVLGNGDLFYENLTIQVLNGLGAPPTYAALPNGYEGFPPIVPPANLYIDLALNGFITGYSDGGTPTTASTPLSITDDTYTSIFSSGAASMYTDNNGDQIYNAGDVLVASFSLVGAGPFILTPSIFAGAGAQISFGFDTSYTNPAYFSLAPGYPDWFNYVNSGFLLTLTQGGVAVVGQFGGDTGPNPDEILIAFQETGFDAKFDAIPEPTSMLLLGTGLAGLAGIGRRRKKSAKK